MQPVSARHICIRMPIILVGEDLSRNGRDTRLQRIRSPPMLAHKVRCQRSACCILSLDDAACAQLSLLDYHNIYRSGVGFWLASRCSAYTHFERARICKCWPSLEPPGLLWSLQKGQWSCFQYEPRTCKSHHSGGTEERKTRHIRRSMGNDISI